MCERIESRLQAQIGALQPGQLTLSVSFGCGGCVKVHASENMHPDAANHEDDPSGGCGDELLKFLATPGAPD